MGENKNLCSSCSNSIWCSTFAEVKCTAKKKRIYNYAEMTECADFKKRPAKWKEMRCGCEDCQKNELLMEDLDEEG